MYINVITFVGGVRRPRVRKCSGTSRIDRAVFFVRLVSELRGVIAQRKILGYVEDSTVRVLSE